MPLAPILFYSIFSEVMASSTNVGTPNFTAPTPAPALAPAGAS